MLEIVYVILLIVSPAELKLPAKATPAQWRALKTVVLATGFWQSDGGWCDDFGAEVRWFRDNFQLYHHALRHLPDLETTEACHRLSCQHCDYLQTQVDYCRGICNLRNWDAASTAAHSQWSELSYLAGQRKWAWATLLQMRKTHSICGLTHLRDQIGEEAWLTGTMPPPVLLGVLREIQ